MILNPYCADLGWLFEDIKRALAELTRPRIEGEFAGTPVVDLGDGSLRLIVPSEQPVQSADAYIAIRSWEITPDTPHPERHVVQFHSLEPRFMGDPATLDKCVAYVFVHPDQPAVLERLGISLDRPCILRPIGAPAGLRLRESMPETFTVGWAGRDTGAKRVELFVDAVTELDRQGVQVRAAMMGAQLEQWVSEFARRNILCGWSRREPGDPYSPSDAQDFYDHIDVLCITSAQETGPMPLFEALACGVPVVTTLDNPGWTKFFNCNHAAPLAFGLETISAEREQHFARRRHLIRASLMGFTLEGWIEDNVRLAMEVTRCR